MTKYFNFLDRLEKYFFPDRPYSATIDEWSKWHDRSYNKNKFWYVIIYKIIPHISRRLENIWVKPIDWVRFRTTRVYNIIKINSLKPGYYDIDTRMLHGMFSLLVDHVEIEKAAMFGIEDEIKKKQDKGISAWFYNTLPFARKRNPEAGLKYLEWEMSLDDPNSINYSPEQAETAKEIMELYNWWCHARKNKVYRNYFSFNNRLAHDINQDLENMNEQKNTEMLIRLIKIRQSLWV